MERSKGVYLGRRRKIPKARLLLLDEVGRNLLKPGCREKGMTMTEPCKYEAEIAVISTNIHDIKKGQEKQDEKFAKMFKVLDGNGGVGIVTQTALNKASTHRLWWAIPCLITLFGVIIGILTVT